MFRNSIFQPSPSSPTYPFGTSHSVHSLVTAPLTHRLIVLPLQVISYVFHSPAGFTRCSFRALLRLMRFPSPPTIVSPKMKPPLLFPTWAWCQIFASALLRA